MRLILAFLQREKGPLILICLSLGLLGWQRWGMDTSIVYEPSRKDLRLIPKDDHSDGGKSVCRVENTGDLWKIHYDIRPGVSWAFCGMNLGSSTADSVHGLDLAGFDTVVVEIEQFTGTNKSLQMTLKAMDSAVYRTGDNISLKYLTLEFAPPSGRPSETTLPLESYSIPSWWTSRYRVPVPHLNRDRHDVREVEFITASGQALFGSGVVGIRRIEFRGKWVHQEALLRLILGVVLSYVFGVLVYNLYKSVRDGRELRLRERRLEDLANKDPLTGALNRRGLDQALSTLASGCRLGREPTLGVLLLDLDHFKQVNDVYGHDAGDEVLRQTSRVLQDHLREGNLFSRWGGEEFLVAIANIPADRLLQMADKIRQHVESSVRWKDHAVTVSIGLAHGPIDDFPALVKLADEGLYRAKNDGRNRVRSGI